MANDFDESSANEEASKGLSWWYSADVLSRDKSDKTAKRIRRISITDRLLRHPGRLSMVYFGYTLSLHDALPIQIGRASCRERV